jgi:two-component system response regulator (stage 0 sporulation protein F)
MEKIKKIMVVDDDYAVDWLMKRILAKKNIKPLYCNTGTQAIELLNKDKEIHAAFIDIQLPDILGFDLLLKLKEIQPELKAILITAYEFQDPEAQASKAGAYGILKKPIQYQELLRLTDEILKNSTEPK